MTQRGTHPLKAWRETQRMWSDKQGAHVPMSVAEAARRLGVSHQTWAGWEKFEDEPGARVPDRKNGYMRRLYELTNGQVRPDHFHDLTPLRLSRQSSHHARATGHLRPNGVSGSGDPVRAASSC